MPVFDFSTVKELEALDAGVYRCVIGDVEKASGPKAEYYKVKFTVQDEDAEDNVNGRSLFRNYSLSVKSLWALKRFLIAAGYDAEAFAGSVDTDEAMNEVRGNTVDVTVIVKDYLREGDEDPTKVNEVVKVEAPGF